MGVETVAARTPRTERFQAGNGVKQKLTSEKGGEKGLTAPLGMATGLHAQVESGESPRNAQERLGKKGHE